MPLVSSQDYGRDESSAKVVSKFQNIKLLLSIVLSIFYFFPWEDIKRNIFQMFEPVDVAGYRKKKLKRKLVSTRREHGFHVDSSHTVD